MAKATLCCTAKKGEESLLVLKSLLNAYFSVETEECTLRRLLIFAAVIITAFGIIAAIGDDFYKASAVVYTNAQAEKKHVVLIDAGHGGIDPGAIGADGTVEKDINLGISQKLQTMLTLYGFETKMTRTGDFLISDDTAATIRQKKTSDLKKRLKMLEESDADMLISIHQNKYSVSKYSGAQVFYSKGNASSRELALILQSEIKSRLQNDNERQIKPSGSEIYLLYKATKPAVMVECGFMSNPNELENLKKESYQNETALSIFSGIVKYYNEIDGIKG